MKSLRVLKFGGTSLADRDRIRQAAAIVMARRREGHKLVVVVSARAKLTDEMIEDARSFAASPAPREMDMLLTSGERISSALLSLALHAMGGEAISLSGSQAGIITDDRHTNARIIEVRPYRVAKALEEGFIVVVGGFQGVSFKKEITTLGRGGSDVTAVALASALDAEACEIYSDVDGVYAADPRLVDDPRRLDRLSYQEMQEMAEAGAKVLHPRSVEFAKIKNTLIHAKSTLEPHGAGTIIANLEGRIKPRVVGVATEERVVLLQGDGGTDGEGLRRLVDFCQARSLMVKQVSFNLDRNDRLGGSLIVPEKENYHLDAVLTDLETAFAGSIQVRRGLAALSLIGAGITETHECLAESIRLLGGHGIPFASLHTSSFRISFLVERESLRPATRLLYERFIGERD